MLSFPNVEYFLQGQVHILLRGPPQFVQALLTARLQSELQRSSLGKVSDRQIEGDLKLLQMAMEKMEKDEALATFLPSQP